MTPDIFDDFSSIRSSQFGDDDESSTVIDPDLVNDIDDPAWQRKMGKKIYRAVFTEFYDWEREVLYPADIATISQDRTIGLNLELLPFPNVNLKVFSSQNQNPATAAELLFSDLETFTVEIFDQGEKATNSYEVVPSDFTRAGMVFYKSDQLHYQYCTPTSQNILEEHLLGFIPHADDPENFDIEEFLLVEAHLKTHAWQDNFNDPDRDSIQLEVARRMHYDLGLSLQEIDVTNLLRVSLRASNESGLLWEISQRDDPGLFINRTPKLPSCFIPEQYDILNEINIGQTNFCSNLNCIIHNCTMHGTLLPKPLIEHHKTHKHRAWKPTDGQHNACEANCFMKAPHPEIDMQLSWSAEDESLLAGVLRLDPDLSSCDLATICRKPCQEIYIYQQQHQSPNTEVFIEDEYGRSDKKETRKALCDGIIKVKNNVHIKLRLKPCSHAGNCGRDTPECQCFRDQYYCQRNCSCSVDCEIRFPGCRCTNNCIPKLCPCQKAKRECDPELCLSCNARGGTWTTRRCKNVNLQQEEKFHALEIKSAEYGMGAFALDDIPAKACVGEYVGEIQHEELSQQSDLLHKYCGLNYTFEHYASDESNRYFTCLDSARVGNETRYLNHSKTPNCVVHSVLVHGDLRLALLTYKEIKKGEELFLNYGENYWIYSQKN